LENQQMPNATVRADARADSTDHSAVVHDGLFLALRAEIEELKVQRRPLKDTADALYQSFEHTIREDGFEAARAWGNSVGLDPKLEEIEQIDRRAGHLIERMLKLGPKTPASIAAVASVLKEEVLDHLWDKPEDDRDWDVELLTRFLDGLIALLPRTANEVDHIPGLASAA
jgi:hypothetical protein